MAKPKYYSLKKILEHNATYNIIIGKRSNGKTFAVLKKIVEDFWNGKGQGAIIRRWDEDIRGKRAQMMFDGIVSEGIINKLTNDEWTHIRYVSGKWYFARKEVSTSGKEKWAMMDTPAAFGFALTMVEHDKGTSYSGVTNVMFDEFMTRGYYLPDEVQMFMNTLSTIIRDRDNVVIFMLGNTVNKYCPYFQEMNITGIYKQKQGTIDIYTYVRNKDLKVAVEYCGEGASRETRLASDKYFGFDNPRLNMITHGTWEMAMYPRLPCKYTSKDVMYRYYIVFDGNKLQGEIINVNDLWFTFIHPWTSDIPPTERCYSPDYNASLYHTRKITAPLDAHGRFIYWFFKIEKVFYSNNEVGEIVRNYLKWCRTDSST